MNNLFIIPARGGSTRLKDKNIILLKEKPLIYYTLDVVVEFANDDDLIILSTDSNKIKKIVKQHRKSHKINIEPQWWASNTSKSIQTVKYYFNKYRGYKKIWQLLPTCPLRTVNDLKIAQDILGNDIDGVVSITDYEFPPTLGLIYKDGIIEDWHESQPWKNGNSRSQDHPKIYRPNGALYVMWSSSFEIYKNFYHGRIGGYYMPRSRSIDIDTEYDLKVAKTILRNQK